MERPYTGPIDVDQALTGVRLCVENANALVKEAELLLNNGGAGRAVALAVIALEELGKIPKIVNFGRYQRLGRWRQFWRAFRSHVDKLDLHGGAVAATVGTDEKQVEQWLKREVSLAGLQDLKLRSLYVDHDGNDFTSPGSIPDTAEIAGRLIHVVKDGIEFHTQLGGQLDRNGLIRQQVRSELFERFIDGAITEDEFLQALKRGVDVREH